MSRTNERPTPDFLLWAYQLKKEHSYLLERVIRLEASLAQKQQPTPPSSHSSEALNARLARIEEVLEKQLVQQNNITAFDRRLSDLERRLVRFNHVTNHLGTLQIKCEENSKEIYNMGCHFDSINVKVDKQASDVSFLSQRATTMEERIAAHGQDVATCVVKSKEWYSRLEALESIGEKTENRLQLAESGVLNLEKSLKEESRYLIEAEGNIEALRTGGETTKHSLLTALGELKWHLEQLYGACEFFDEKFSRTQPEYTQPSGLETQANLEQRWDKECASFGHPLIQAEMGVNPSNGMESSQITIPSISEPVRWHQQSFPSDSQPSRTRQNIRKRRRGPIPTSQTSFRGRKKGCDSIPPNSWPRSYVQSSGPQQRIEVVQDTMSQTTYEDIITKLSRTAEEASHDENLHKIDDSRSQLMFAASQPRREEDVETESPSPAPCAETRSLKQPSAVAPDLPESFMNDNRVALSLASTYRLTRSQTKAASRGSSDVSASPITLPTKRPPIANTSTRRLQNGSHPPRGKKNSSLKTGGPMNRGAVTSTQASLERRKTSDEPGNQEIDRKSTSSRILSNLKRAGKQLEEIPAKRPKGLKSPNKSSPRE